MSEGIDFMEQAIEKHLSFIIPVYQVKDTLRGCVESCCRQSFLRPEEYEIILVDDGSTDGSSQLCDELEKEMAVAITVIHTPNGGVSRARNLGLEKATGRFVAFVDSDDAVSEGYFDKLSRYADESTVIVDETDSYEGNGKLSGYQYIENSILNANTHVWGKIFDRQTLIDNNIRFREGLSIGEDLLFLLDVALLQGKKHTIRCIPHEGNYKYNDNAEGAMLSSFKKSYLDQIVCWREAEEKLNEHRQNLSQYAFVSLACSQIMTALLIIGKLAVQDEKDRDVNLTTLAIQQVQEQIEHALKTRGAFAGLSSGYKLKVMLFRFNPDMYIRMYHRHKS